MNRKDRKQQKKKQRQERIRRQKHFRHFGGGSMAFTDGSPEFESDTEGAEWVEAAQADTDERFQRIDAIIGDSLHSSLGAAVRVYCDYLRKSLVLPCEVTGSEDFRWEEYYVIGPGKKAEHARLRRAQPSYLDRYELLAIEHGPVSVWMLFAGDDIAAHVRRISDGKEFVLGLSELKSVGRQSPNAQLLDDFSVFLVNSR
jgi:hypothetical protein